MIEAQFGIVILLIVGSFIAGLKLANHYHNAATADKEYALEKQFVRLKAGTDADDPAGPYLPKRRVEIAPEFERRLKENGRATAAISKSS